MEEQILSFDVLHSYKKRASTCMLPDCYFSVMNITKKKLNFFSTQKNTFSHMFFQHQQSDDESAIRCVYFAKKL